MALVYLKAIGRDGLYFAMPVEGPVDPGFGSGIGGDRPDNSLPWAPGHPGNRPPGSGGGGNYPSNGLPGSPGHPDNRPPATRPPTVNPGETLVLVRDPAGVWHYATTDNSSPPPKPVPVPPPDHIGGKPPGTGIEHPSGQPVPPVPAPV